MNQSKINMIMTNHHSNNPFDPNIDLSHWREYNHGYDQYTEYKRSSVQYILTLPKGDAPNAYLLGMVDAYKRAELTTLITGKQP